MKLQFNAREGREKWGLIRLDRRGLDACPRIGRPKHLHNINVVYCTREEASGLKSEENFPRHQSSLPSRWIYRKQLEQVQRNNSTGESPMAINYLSLPHSYRTLNVNIALQSLVKSPSSL